MRVFDNKGYTPLLHHAVQKGFFEVARMLVWEFGADAKAAGTSGDTPLHVAAMEGNTEAVNMLVRDLGAVGSRNANGHTP